MSPCHRDPQPQIEGPSDDLTVRPEYNLAADAMRWAPGRPDDPMLVRGLLIPSDTRLPVTLVTLRRDQSGSVASAIREHLGHACGEWVTSTVSFLESTAVRRSEEFHGNINTRATRGRLALWHAAVDGCLAVSDRDIQRASRRLDTLRARHAFLVGDVLVLGTGPRGWTSIPDGVADRLLRADNAL